MALREPRVSKAVSVDTVTSRKFDSASRRFRAELHIVGERAKPELDPKKWKPAFFLATNARHVCAEIVLKQEDVSMLRFHPIATRSLASPLNVRHQIYQPQIHKCAMESTFPFGDRCEVGFSAVFKQARPGGKNRIKREACSLQGNGS